MKERILIYIDKKSIYCISENHPKNFEYIFKNRAAVYLDMTQNELDELDNCDDCTNMDDLSFYFYNTIGVTPFSGKSVFDVFYSQKERISDDFNGCIFILDIPMDKAKSLREESGIWILSKDEIENDVEVENLVLDIIYMDREDVIPNTKYNGKDKNGWFGLFGPRLVHFPPFNEIIIYDNFIKEYVNSFKAPPYITKNVNGEKVFYTYIGLENTLLLLNAILPVNHYNPIKIIISLPKEKKDDYEERLEKRLKIWIKEIKQLRQYEIKVSILLIGNKKWKEDNKECHPLHPRILYTNFFSIGTEKGFKFFYPYPFSNIVKEDGDSKNNISISSYFHSPKMLSNPIQANYNIKLKDIGKQIRNEKNNNLDSLNNSIIGDKININDFSLFKGINFDE